jgi:hypothetical protein
MSAFRTPVELPDYSFKISHSDLILSMGSCFAEQMAQRLQHLKFRVSANPFGILYHPQVIADSLQHLLKGYTYQPADLFEHRGVWSHFDFHSSFSATSAEESLEKMNASLRQAHRALAEASRLVITLGTAYAWWHKDQERVVANCHKLPGARFERRLISVDAMREALVQAINALRKVNPDIICLVTVSPIRHIRDGLIENQLSKSSLRLLAHQLGERLSGVYYFPSYEIMVDDLREYRFYARDMIHPSEEALDYIWNAFQKAFFSSGTQSLVQQIEKINRGLAHRPQFPESESHQQFQARLLQEMEAIEQKHTFISFLSEKTKLLS